MKRMATVALTLVGAVLVSGVGMAGPTGTLVAMRDGKGTPVRPGVWHAGLEETRKYAEEHGLPLMAVWSNGDNCSHCKYFENAANSQAFQQFMKESGIVFMFAYCNDPKPDGPEGGATHKWCSHNWDTSGYPYVRFWWKKDGKQIVDMWVNGDKVRGNKSSYSGSKSTKKPDYPDFVVDGESDYGTFEPAGRYSAWYVLNKAFPTWTPEPPAPQYAGGDFTFGDTEGQRLETVAGAGATTVDVPVTRTNKQAVATTYTNTVSWAGGSQKIVWAAGETVRYVKVPVAMDVAGKQIAVQLKDDAGAVVAERHITYVNEPDNAPSNPVFTGAEVGQWTMDFEAATNKVRAGGADYALVLVSGALWCPWCCGIERDVFADSDIKSFLSTKKVIPVILDNPTRSDGAPSLLLYETGFSYGLKKDVSGAGYLSRTEVSEAERTRVLQRNHMLGYTSVLDGGLCDIGRERMGYPSVLLIGADGRIVRVSIEDRADFGFTASAFKLRLNEAMTVMEDAKEESNNYWQTTPETAIGSRDISITAREVSACDSVDVYPVAETCKGKYIYFGISGAPSAAVSLTLFRVRSGIRTDLSTVTNAEGIAGFALEASQSVEASDQFFLEVRGDVSKAPFTPDHNGSSFYSYSLESDFILIPEEAQKEMTVDDGNYSVAMKTEAGVTYRLIGIDAGNLPAGLTAGGSSPDLYISDRDAVLDIRLLGANFKYQIWKTGSLTFSKSAVQVNENIGTCAITVLREGGSAGVAEGYVRLNTEKTTSLSQIYEWTHDNETNRWEEGDSSEWTLPLKIVDNDYCDGNQQIVIDLFETAASDAGVKIGEITVTVVENNKRTAGKVAMAGSAPDFAGTMKVIAKGSSDVRITVRRTGGADGSVGAGMTASAGTLSIDRFDWESRQGSEIAKETVLSLPSYAAAKKATVKLVADKGTALDSARRTLTVEIVPENAVEFMESAAGVSCYRYVEAQETRLRVNPATIVSGGGKVSVSKVSGSLPAGLKATWSKESNELVISGVPTKAGTYRAVYRAKQGSVAGLTCVFSAVVTDPAVVPAGGAAINPNVGKAQKFNDLVVMDEENGRMTGLLSVSVGKTGKGSAKYRSVDHGTVSFASKDWSRLGKLEDIALEHVRLRLKEILSEAEYDRLAGITFAVNEMIGTTTATKSFSLTLCLGDGDEMLAFFDNPGDAGFSGLTVLAPTFAWSKRDPATAWKGSYTVNFQNLGRDGDDDVGERIFCRGDAYAALKMTSASAVNAGKMTYAGCLPNGKAFSGSGVIQPYFDAGAEGETSALLPIVQFSTADDFTALLEIFANAAAEERRFAIAGEGGISPYWHHKEKADGAAYATEFSAYGTYYNGDDADDIVESCQSTFGTLNLTFFALTDGIRSEVHGPAASWPTNTTGIVVAKDKSGKVTISVANAKNTQSLKMTFSRSTGVVNGTFKCPFADGTSQTMTYRGVVLPGFGSATCTGCDYKTPETQERPFIGGSCWLSEKHTYPGPSGKTRSLTVKRGGAFSVGTEEGK